MSIYLAALLYVSACGVTVAFMVQASRHQEAQSRRKARLSLAQASTKPRGRPRVKGV